MDVHGSRSISLEPCKVLRPFNQGDTLRLSFIDDARAEGITPWLKPIRIYMPNGQITAMLGDKNERRRGQFRLSMQRGPDGVRERRLPAAEVAREQNEIPSTK